MTLVQRTAQVFGWGFVVIGIAGFLASGASMDPNHETAPRLLGLFPVNLLHNFVHLVLGVWGIASSRGFGVAKVYCLASGGLYLLLALLGIMAPDGFGLLPLGGNDVGLHAVLAIPLVLVGAFASRRATASV